MGIYILVSDSSKVHPPVPLEELLRKFFTLGRGFNLGLSWSRKFEN